MKKADLVAVCVGIGLIFFTQRELFRPGLPLTHDSQNHLARFASYYLALKEGQIPPRWADNLNNGFGYPVFNFNYPLPNMVAAPLIGVNLSIQNTMKVQIFVTLVLSLLGSYLWLRQYFAVYPTFTGSLYYAMSPYVLNLIYVRGVIGENWAYALFPWFLWLIDKNVGEKKLVHWYQVGLAVVGGMFLLSHNIIVLLGFPVLLVYAVYKVRSNLIDIRKLLIPSILALMLSMFFWLPALLEKKYTVLDQARVNQEYTRHFLRPGQLLFSGLDFGFSRIGPVDGIRMGIGWLGLLIVMISLVVFCRNKFRPRYLFYLATFLLFVVLLTLQLTHRLWELIPFLSYVQFPWRIMFFAPLVMTIFLAFLTSYNKWVGSVLLLLALFGLLNLTASTDEERFDFNDEYWLTYPQTTSVLDENMPRWMSQKSGIIENELFTTAPLYFLNENESLLSLNKTSILSADAYSVSLPIANTIIHQLSYFPGWKASVNRQPYPIDFQIPGKEGLVALELPAGDYEVSLNFTQQTLPRILGNFISLLAIVSIFFISLMIIWKDYFHRSENKVYAKSS